MIDMESRGPNELVLKPSRRKNTKKLNPTTSTHNVSYRYESAYSDVAISLFFPQNVLSTLGAEYIKLMYVF